MKNATKEEKRILLKLQAHGYKDSKAPGLDDPCVCHLVNKPKPYKDKTLLIVK